MAKRGLSKAVHQFLHDKLGWVSAMELPSKTHGDTFYKCQLCDTKITLDSQGNWFHLEGIDYRD